MKKSVLVPFFVLIATCGYAQSRGDIFGNVPITWLGLDFSHLKFIGRATDHANVGHVTESDMQAEYFPSWNDLIFSEHEKFNIAAAVNRDFVGYSLEQTKKKNTQSAGKYFTDNKDEYQMLTIDSISRFVYEYDFGKKTGIGLLFFVEGMNRKKMEASMWVTFVAMKSKRVLLTERMVGMAGGAGFRNFWARSFFNVFWDMRKEFGRDLAE